MTWFSFLFGLLDLPYVKEVLIAVIGLSGFGWVLKRNEKNKTSAKNYKKAYEDEKERNDLDEKIGNLPDPRLDKLLKPWRRD